MTNIEKLQTLLSHDELEMVHQGLALLDIFAHDSSFLHRVLGYSQHSHSVKELTHSLPDWTHKNHIRVWVLGKLAQFDVPWVKELTELDLHNNALGVLPDSIGNLTALRTLNLEKNQLTSLPQSMEKLSNLVHLDVSNNLLTALFENIGNLSQLEKLYCNKNKISSLPYSFAKLKKLIELRVSSNPLKSLACIVGELDSLLFLLACGTQLPEDEKKTLHKRYSLRIARLTLLELSRNHTIYTIKHLRRLGELSLRESILLINDTPAVLPIQKRISDVKIAQIIDDLLNHEAKLAIDINPAALKARLKEKRIVLLTFLSFLKRYISMLT